MAIIFENLYERERVRIPFKQGRDKSGSERATMAATTMRDLTATENFAVV